MKQKDPFQYEEIDPILKSSDFLRKKHDLVDYLESLGLEVENSQPYDMSGDGKAESLMMRFSKGEMNIVVGLNNYSYSNPKKGRKGKFAYQFKIFMSRDAGGEVLLSYDSEESIAEDINQIKKVVRKYVEQGRLKNLGVKDAEAFDIPEEEEDYIPSKKEYDEMLNNAIDSNDRKRAEEIVNKWGDRFYKENTSYKRSRIKSFSNFVNENLTPKDLLLAKIRSQNQSASASGNPVATEPEMRAPCWFSGKRISNRTIDSSLNSDREINWEYIHNKGNGTTPREWAAFYNKMIALAIHTGDYKYISRKGFESFGVDDFRKFLMENIEEVNEVDPETGRWSVNFK